MPITIKSTELKYKNPSTGQYQGIDAVAETTTSQQCALIEAKGAETIASIPSDYTTLSDNVSDLNGATTSVEKGLAIIVTGDTCTTAVPSGGYAYIKNNTHGLAEGLYRNKTASAFPTSGGTANSTIFEAVSSGIANQVTPVSLGGTGATTVWNAKTNLQVGLRAGTFVAQTSGTTINVPSSRQFFCFADGGLFQFTAASTGGTNVKTMVAASQNITFNTSTLNKIIVTPASYAITMYWICFFDNAITT